MGTCTCTGKDNEVIAKKGYVWPKMLHPQVEWRLRIAEILLVLNIRSWSSVSAAIIKESLKVQGPGNSTCNLRQMDRFGS